MKACWASSRLAPHLLLVTLLKECIVQRHSEANAQQDADPVGGVVPPGPATAGAVIGEAVVCGGSSSSSSSIGTQQAGSVLGSRQGRSHCSGSGLAAVQAVEAEVEVAVTSSSTEKPKSRCLLLLGSVSHGLR